MPRRIHEPLAMTGVLETHKLLKLRMRGRQFLCATFLFFVCLAYYMMAYGQTTAADVMLAMSTVDHLEMAIASEPSNTSDSSPCVIDKPNLCGDVNRTLSLLILVITAPNNMESRLSIRRTWGTIAHRSDVKLVFVLGSSTDNGTQQRINAEDLQYADLIQGRFIDAYNNLTRKSVLMLKWAHTRCPNAKFVLKIDDDCFLHHANLQKFLNDRKETSAIFGRVWTKVKPIRDAKDKWSVSKEVFPADEFPNYTGGPSYVLTSGAAIQALLQVIRSGQATWLDLEDVYVTGVVAEKANVQRINSNSFNMDKYPSVCDARDVITYHRVTPDMMHVLWWIINDDKWKQSCDSKEKHKVLVEVANVIMSNLHP